MMGGGIGVYAGMRSPDEKSTGVMAHMSGYDADALSYKQSKSRRGSIATYADINSPEILSFIRMRDPASGGDINSKCFNLNNAVNITDEFMEAVIKGEKYELVDVKHGPTGDFLEAREVWEEILETRHKTGEPYLNFIDSINRDRNPWITKASYKVSQSNLCVAPETLVLTDKGHEVIKDLCDKKVNVWNGEEFSEVTVRKTGEEEKLVTVKTNQGFEIDCTPDHKFYVKNGFQRDGKDVEKRAYELVEGDKLIKFDLPTIQGKETLYKAYENGFYSGDGCEVKGKSRIYLYHEKRDLLHLFKDYEAFYDDPKQKRVHFYSLGLKKKFFVPDSSYTIQSRLDWLAGFLDSDGTVARNGVSQTLQAASVEVGFLEEVQLMLQTLGISSKVCFNVPAGRRLLPKNDGTGELGYYNCKETKRLLIPGMGIVKLKELGLKTHRLEISDHVPNRDARNFITVESVTDYGRVDDTYCFTEPKRHMGVFNGILTGQCNEIMLMTSPKRTAVCCLSSLNLAKFDEWKDSNIVQDLVRYLDNVLEFFIRLAPPQLKRAVHSASQERAVGLGTLGYHSYFQSKGIPFESGGFNSAVQHTNMIYSHIQEKAIEGSKQLAQERGCPEDCIGGGMRNSHLMAIAPNASSSDMVGESPSIEPWAANCFTAQGRAGSFLVKNKYLEELLREEYNKDSSEVWKSIAQADGSVQHLTWMKDEHRQVFKTAREIDPLWIVELASMRQQYIDQGQSVNLFKDNTWNKQYMSDVHVAAWAKGLKGLYYMRGKKADSRDTEKPLNSFKIDYEPQTCISCEG
jgi:ribonucleoside-diphosphate reductase alpha chain